MNADQTHETLLREVIEQVVQNNRQVKPGTPMAELQAAIESIIEAIPPLEFEEFDQTLGDVSAIERLIRRAPEMIGWDADQVVEWVEELIKIELPVAVKAARLGPSLATLFPPRKPRLFGGS